MRQPDSTISRDIILDGAAIDVSRVVSGLAVFIAMASGSVHVEVSADGAAFVRVAATVTGQSFIALPLCQAVRIVSATTPVETTLQWNGAFR